MKVEIEIDETELKALVMQKLADKCLTLIWDGDYRLPYEKQQADARARQKEIMDKIDWKNAGSKLSETVVQKFFMKLLDGK